MFAHFPAPRYMPCAECGASVEREHTESHRCERERWLDYQVFLQRADVEELDGEVGAYLASPEGQFELWCAERDRIRDDRGDAPQ